MIVSTNQIHAGRAINLDKPEDYRRLLKDGTSWRGVLHAWTLDAAFNEANALPDLNHAEHLGCRSALFLVQALAETANSQPPKLWLLTRGAQPAWPQARLNSIAQAPIWGLGRTFALEHPELWGGLIDVAADGDPHVLAKRIALEMCFPDGEDQIALSEDLRLVPRLLPAQPPSPTPMAIKPDASYLITGGLGGLGPHIAEWLVKSGARHLILCGRRELPERSTWGELAPSHQSYEQVAAIQKLEKQGATVHVEKVDVADRGQMEALFERVRRSSEPLCGIIHAAADIKILLATRDECGGSARYHARESRRHVVTARTLMRFAAGFLRALLVDRGSLWRESNWTLCRFKSVSRFPCSLAPRGRSAGTQCQLGRLGRNSFAG